MEEMEKQKQNTKDDAAGTSTSSKGESAQLTPEEESPSAPLARKTRKPRKPRVIKPEWVLETIDQTKVKGTIIVPGAEGESPHECVVTGPHTLFPFPNPRFVHYQVFVDGHLATGEEATAILTRYLREGAGAEAFRLWCERAVLEASQFTPGPLVGSSNGAVRARETPSVSGETGADLEGESVGAREVDFLSQVPAQVPVDRPIRRHGLVTVGEDDLYRGGVHHAAQQSPETTPARASEIQWGERGKQIAVVLQPWIQWLLAGVQFIASWCIAWAKSRRKSPAPRKRSTQSARRPEVVLTPGATSNGNGTRSVRRMGCVSDLDEDPALIPSSEPEFIRPDEDPDPHYVGESISEPLLANDPPAASVRGDGESAEDSSGESAHDDGEIPEDTRGPVIWLREMDSMIPGDEDEEGERQGYTL